MKHLTAVPIVLFNTSSASQYPNTAIYWMSSIKADSRNPNRTAFQPFLLSRNPNGMNSRILRAISHQNPIRISQNNPLVILTIPTSLEKRVTRRIKKIYRGNITFRFFSPNGAPFSALLFHTPFPHSFFLYTLISAHFILPSLYTSKPLNRGF